MARLGSRRTAAVCGAAVALSFSLGGCGGSAGRGLPIPAPPGPSSAAAGGGESTGLTPEGMPGSWHLVFDDEFDSGSLDTSRWSTGWLAPGITGDVSINGIDCDDPRQVSVAHGSLALAAVERTETCRGKVQKYATGAINTEGKESFLHGAFEARIYLPPATDGEHVANWPAWWADGEHWPTDGEMDVMEGLNGLACYHLRYSASAEQAGCAPGNFSGWHTYGADWENGSITYYYDGYKIGVATNAGVTVAPQFLVLNYGLHKGSSYIRVPATMLVDYVRVWQH